jgi:hypothetical protein
LNMTPCGTCKSGVSGTIASILRVKRLWIILVRIKDIPHDGRWRELLWGGQSTTDSTKQQPISCSSTITDRHNGVAAAKGSLSHPSWSTSRCELGLKSLFTLRMWAICSYETSVPTRATQRHIPEDGILHSHRRENRKSYIALTSWTL